MSGAEGGEERGRDGRGREGGKRGEKDRESNDIAY